MIESNEIVAFLQNPWFEEGTLQRLIDAYRADIKLRRKVLAESMTGKRLLSAFGEDWYNSILWDNANPTESCVASGFSLPDFSHIRKVIEQNKPKLILTFGAHARGGICAVQLADMTEIPHLICHHPNARHKTMQDLIDFANTVKIYCSKQE